MTPHQMNLYLATILSTLAACDGTGIAGHLYAGLMHKMSLADFNAIVATLTKAELIINSSDVLTLTDKGATVAAAYDAMVANAVAITREGLQ